MNAKEIRNVKFIHLVFEVSSPEHNHTQPKNTIVRLKRHAVNLKLGRARIHRIDSKIWCLFDGSTYNRWIWSHRNTHYTIHIHALSLSLSQFCSFLLIRFGYSFVIAVEFGIWLFRFSLANACYGTDDKLFSCSVAQYSSMWCLNEFIEITTRRGRDPRTEWDEETRTRISSNS